MEPLLPRIPFHFFAEAGEDIGWNIFWYVGLVMLIVLAIFTIARRGVTDRVFVGLPARAVEHMILFIEGIALGVIGSHGKKYIPILVALWAYIFVANVLGLILNFTPTAEWSLNISLSILAVVYVQWEGIRANGLFGHLKHFAGPKMTGALVLVSGLLFLIEIVSETMKMFSLSIRLYGNIHGGHEVVTNLNRVLVIAGHDIPLGGLLLPIKFLTCVLQAYVFIVLTATYLSLVTSHDHAAEEHHDTGNPHPVAA